MLPSLVPRLLLGLVPAPVGSSLHTSPSTGVYCDTYIRDMDSLLGMVARAGSCDTALLTQMYESPYSGASDSNAADDPNRRLEAHIAAARQGAVVRIMLGFVLRRPGGCAEQRCYMCLCQRHSIV